VVFDPCWSLAVPNQAGLYIIRDLRGTLYVGRTCSLHRRFAEHWERSHSQGLAAAIRSPIWRLEFIWIDAPSSDLPALECGLIAALNPKCNVLHNLSD